MPGRIFPFLIVVFWLIFFSLGFYEQWQKRGKQVVTAKELFSTEASMQPRVERLIFDGKERARIYTMPSMTQSNLDVRFSVTLDKSISNPPIRANGQLVYNTLYNFIYASLEWGERQNKRGFLARADKGKLKLEPIGMNMFTEKEIDFVKDQVFTIDPTLSVAVPHLVVGQSWTFNSYLDVFAKIAEGVTQNKAISLIDGELNLIANAVKWEKVSIPGDTSYERNAMRVEVKTFTQNPIPVFTSWVNSQGVVLRSEFKFQKHTIVKELVYDEGQHATEDESDKETKTSIDEQAKKADSALKK